ncbi:MAG: beta-ketoacyl-ACP synthase III [Bacillota bacterium]
MPEPLRPVGIVGLGAAAGEDLLTNNDLEKMVDTSDEWIKTRTGIGARHITRPETATSDLAYQAAVEGLADAGLTGADLDLIIVCTVTPDMPFPSTACLLQARLGATRAAAFDIEAACSGFIYGLAVGGQFVASRTYDTVLVIGAETLTKITDYTDRATCVLFGDGAGAAVLRPVGEGEGILSTVLGADGSGGELLMQPAGGSRLPASHETVDKRLHYIHMSGSDVFKFAVKVMGEAADAAIERAGLSREDVDFLVPHQANRRIIDAAARRLGLPADKVIVNIGEFGNMSSASIPVALHEAVRSGRIKRGDVVVLVAFGAGLTWGSTALRWCR